ncbi:MAG: hypothetical protein MI920_00770 [Kiloniellales bacterium]|nr:hypothetical protein [Kiloniellales bacterium]
MAAPSKSLPSEAAPTRQRPAETATGLPLVATGALLLSLIVGGLAVGAEEQGKGAPDLARSPASGQELVAPILTADAEALDRALAAMRLAAAEKERLRIALASEGMKLGQLTLWDRAARDRGVVALASAGFRQDVEIGQEPLTVIIPYRERGVVTLTALQSSEQGVTLALATADQPLQLQPLQSGESIEVSIP